MNRTHVARALVGLLAGVLLIPVASTSTARVGSPQQARSTPAGSLSLSSFPAITGERFTASGRLPTAIGRPVFLQRQPRGSSWTTIASGTSTRQGRFRFAVSLSDTAQLRVLAPRTSQGGRTLMAFYGPARYQVISQQGGHTLPPPSVAAAKPFTLSAFFTPARPGRHVTFEQFVGTTWKNLGTGTQGNNGTATIQATAASSGRFVYRATAEPARGAPAWTTERVGTGVVPENPLGNRSVAGIGTGSNHTCVLDTDGYAWCWGENGSGQLGDGTTTARGTPDPLSGGLRFAELSASGSCGLTDSGEVWCWGEGHQFCEVHHCSGQSPRPFRIDVAPLESVSGNGRRGCGLAASGATRCWLESYDHDSGEPVTTTSLLQGGHTFSEVSVGEVSACGLDLQGSAWCWGSNFQGRLGDGTATDSDLPVPVFGGHEFTHVEVGDASACATAADGIWCWGEDVNFTGDSPDGTVPTLVEDSAGLSVTSVSQSVACATDSEDVAWCWGNNRWGGVGDGTTEHRESPVAVSGGQTFTTVATGAGTACGITAEHRVWCWGNDRSGQLGDGVLLSSSAPHRMVGDPVITSFETGGSTCGLLENTTMTCWGLSSGEGELFGTPEGSIPAPAVGAGAGLVAVSAGNDFRCALDSAGLARCRGHRSHGDLGKDLDQHTFASISAGGESVCAVDTAQAAWCWGSNSNGQLGNGETAKSQPIPVLVAGGHDFVSVSAGGYHTCALDVAGAAWCWGRGDLLGARNTDDSAVPMAVGGGHRLVSLDTGSSSSCAIDTDQHAWCWGYGFEGQLGTGGPLRTAPTPVRVDLEHVASLVVTGASACALVVGGEAWCWGYNAYGQLGNGTRRNASGPVAVLEGHAFTTIGVSGSNACGSNAQGSWCWGDNSGGELGDGRIFHRPEPGPVVTD